MTEKSILLQRERLPAAHGADDDLLVAVHERMARATAFGEGLAELGLWLKYHMGWSDLDGNPVAARSAKDLRPRVCLTACRALGGETGRAVCAAAAVELTHEFSLIHDDIEDGDRTRRGRPALWTVVGVAQAINAGDALFAAARGELSSVDAPPAVAREMHRRYDEATLALAQGQYLDLAYETRFDASPDAYLAMAARKTGALLGLAAALGALSAGATEAADPMYLYGREIGVGFQIADDVLGMWGDPSRTGKPAGADLARGKKSYPVTLALNDDDIAPFVRAALSGTPEAIAQALRRMEASGVREIAERAAAEHSQAALDHLRALPLDVDGLAALRTLARLATERMS